MHVGLRVGGLGECVVGMVDKGKMGVRGTGVRVRGKGVRVQRCVRRVCTCVVHAHLDAHVPQSVTTSRGPARSRRERLPRAALPTLARLVTSVSPSPIRFHIPTFTPFHLTSHDHHHCHPYPTKHSPYPNEMLSAPYLPSAVR